MTIISQIAEGAQSLTFEIQERKATGLLHACNDRQVTLSNAVRKGHGLPRVRVFFVFSEQSTR